MSSETWGSWPSYLARFCWSGSSRPSGEGTTDSFLFFSLISDWIDVYPKASDRCITTLIIGNISSTTNQLSQLKILKRSTAFSSHVHRPQSSAWLWITTSLTHIHSLFYKKKFLSAATKTHTHWNVMYAYECPCILFIRPYMLDFYRLFSPHYLLLALDNHLWHMEPVKIGFFFNQPSKPEDIQFGF